MRGELSQAVARLFAGRLPAPRERGTEEAERLVSLATFVVRARSAVERDGYSREIELVPEAEAPTRLVLVLDRLLAGLDAIGAKRDQGWAVVTRCALDSIPAIRRACLDDLAGQEQDAKTADVAGRIGYPTNTARRALEELAAHGLADRIGLKANLHAWRLTEWARGSYAALGELSRNVG